jgi:hypothetical protein
MTLEKVLVHAHLLDAYNAYTRDELNNAIYKQKGITVREKFLNSQGVENSFHS